MKCNSPFDGSVNDRAIIAVNCELPAGHAGPHQKTLGDDRECFVGWKNDGQATKEGETR